MKFKDHLTHPLNHEEPHIYNMEGEVKTKSSRIKIFLDINSKDQIKDFHYLLEGEKGWLPFLSALSVIVKGKNIEEAYFFSSDTYTQFFQQDHEYLDFVSEFEIPFFNLPLFLLKKTIKDYRGDIDATEAMAKNCKEENLICRCFGVYKEEIEKLIKTNSHFEIKDIVEKTYASAGCGNCEADVDDIYLEMRRRFPLEKKEPKENIETISDAKMILMIDEHIQNFCIKNNLDPAQVEILDFANNLLTLQYEDMHDGLPKEVTMKLEAYLKEMGLKQIKIFVP